MRGETFDYFRLRLVWKEARKIGQTRRSGGLKLKQDMEAVRPFERDSSSFQVRY